MLWWPSWISEPHEKKTTKWEGRKIQSFLVGTMPYSFSKSIKEVLRDEEVWDSPYKLLTMVWGQAFRIVT